MTAVWRRLVPVAIVALSFGALAPLAGCTATPAGPGTVFHADGATHPIEPDTRTTTTNS